MVSLTAVVTKLFSGKPFIVNFTFGVAPVFISIDGAFLWHAALCYHDVITNSQGNNGM